MKIRRLGLGGLALSLALGFWACSSDDSSGSGNAAGSSASSGGSSGSNGTSGSGGSQSTGGGQSSAGGASGSSSGGAGSSAAGSSAAGSSGSGGASTDASTKSDAPVSLDATGGGDGGAFKLTSSAYTEGMTIPAVYTCAGANTSPPLAWTPGPAGTMSYTLIFTDKSNMLVHWALWDIPVATTSLPAALAAGMPAGSHGASIGANGGYAGPCPGANVHTYQFDLYAVDVATLPGLTAASKQPAVVTAVMGHKLGVASLSGTAKTM